MIRRYGWLAIRFLIACALLAGFAAHTQSTFAVSPNVVISQVYGAGGNSGAVLRNDFIELFNRGTTTVSLSGWSVQYTSATGTGLFSANVTNLSGSLAPGQYYLVQASGGANGAALPTPDATGTIAMAAGAGKVILANTTTGLACNGSSTPCSAAQLAQIVDLVGYGTGTSGANFFEGAGPAPTISTTLADFRAGNGCTDTDNNNTDFAAAAPNPRNTNSALNPCGNSSPTPTATPPTTTPTATPPTPTATPTPPTPTPTPPTVRIREIQGSSHSSSLSGQTVSNVEGIVTALRTSDSSRGFFFQDPTDDGNPATSEGLFVFTGSTSNPASLVSVGDLVKVSGRVSEFRPGGASSTNLTTTQISSSALNVVSSGNALPAATIIGSGGRVPPTTVIEDDTSGSVETGGIFDPASDGIDFYESLEGMLIQINNAVAVGPTNNFGEIAVLADDGANASLRTPRGGIIIRTNDFNPERIILDDVIRATPLVNVGDHFSASVLGVMDYGFGNFKLLVTNALTGVSGNLQRETTANAAAGQLAVATFNVENLDPGDGADKFNTLAEIIVDNLQSPDIIAIEEAQDNNGALNDGTVDATETFNQLIAAIQSQNGPTYSFRNINPSNNQDGGEPGGNIRVGFLFRTDRGVSFVDRPGGTATAAVSVNSGPNGPELSFSPGRIDPTNTAFNSSRKPLVGEFTYNGQKLFVIANHFNSKGGDQPLFGRFQPPTRGSEVQRNQQAQIVNNFVDAILAVDPNANIVAAGDFNDFQFSDAINILKGSDNALYDMIDTLPESERYSYVFDGNSQTLDHILVSGNLFNNTNAIHDVVHVNAEFADQASDHDPQVSFFTLNTAPTVDANGPYTVNEGGSVTISANGSDREGGALSYGWDLDNDGSFETSGQSVSFSAATIDGPGSRTVKVRVTDNGGLSATDEASITIQNVAPVVTAPANQTTTKGATTTFQLGSFADFGLDAPWTAVVDWGDGSAPATETFSTAGSLGTASHSYANVGQYTVTVTVTDKDGGVGTATFTIATTYVFSGFFQPIDNLPALNQLKAGSAVPVKFSLGGNQGLSIFAAGYPKSQQISCDASAPIDNVEETSSAGSSGLSYDAAADRYTYVWKTEKSWAGTCRQLIVQFNDGTTQRATFKFTR